MTPAAARWPADNPFATRYVRPGALPFLFPAGGGLDDLLGRLRRQGWWGQVVGPHGSGKSALAAALVAALPAHGRRPVAACLHTDRRRLPVGLWDDLCAAGPAAVVVIDGYEQLGFWARRAVRSACRRAGAGLLVTTHRPAGLPDLYRTEITPELAGRVVSALLAGRGWRPPGEADLAALLSARRGNLRDVLFDLYDRIEEGRVPGPPPG
jgi:hypothetical protein